MNDIQEPQTEAAANIEGAGQPKPEPATETLRHNLEMHFPQQWLQMAAKTMAECFRAADADVAAASKVKPDMTTAAGRNDARSQRRILRQRRGAIEADRQDVKAPLLALAKYIDERFATKADQVAEKEGIWDNAIKGYETSMAERRQQEEAAEEARVARLKAGISKIRGYVLAAAGASAVEIEGAIDIVSAMVFPTELWQEYASDAAEAKDETLQALRALKQAAQGPAVEG